MTETKLPRSLWQTGRLGTLAALAALAPACRRGGPDDTSSFTVLDADRKSVV